MCGRLHYSGLKGWGKGVKVGATSQPSWEDQSSCLALVSPAPCFPSSFDGTILCYQGSHCEQCLPLFVGSALGGGTCRPCHAFCKGNSHVCVSRKELEMARKEPEKYSLDPEEVRE